MLKHKIAEDEFVELLKDNMNSQMGGLLLTSPITSLAELKREGLRVDRWLRNISVKKEQISTGRIPRRKNPARLNSTTPRAGSARKSGWMQMLTQRLLRGVRQARSG